MDLALRPRTDDRRLKRPPSLAFRLLTASARVRPNFIIIGAMKSGTSSLFSYLCRHPSVAPPLRKETHFFNLAMPAGRSLAWYKAHFPLRAEMRGRRLVGEATPEYLFNSKVPGRIADLRPIKLIAILRDPVERAISHYHHEVRMGREYLSIEDAMRLEDERLEMATRPGREDLETYNHASYKKRGLYLEQLERYWRVFPREDVLVVGTRDLHERPAKVVDETLRFLGVADTGADYDFARKNAAPTKGVVPERVREALAASFEEPNRLLFRSLGCQALW